MLYLASWARMRRPALRGAALPFVALVLATAGAVQAAPVFSVGSPQMIYSANQRRALGLTYWPDGNMGVVANGDGRIQFYAANSTNSVRTIGTLDAPAQIRQNVSIVGATGYNYLAGGPIYHDAATGKRLMVYHAEVHNGNMQNFHTTLGLAVARDAGGLIFDDLGAILSTNSKGAGFNALDMGGGSINLMGDHLYIHYRDYMADGSLSQLAVARASLTDVLAGVTSRQAPQFTKYYNGGWTEPGLGGRAAPLEAGNPDNGWSSVSYNEYLNQFVMATARWSPTDYGDLYLTTSSDGVTWGPRQTLAAGPGEQFYPSLVGTGPDPSRTGKSMYVYYTDSAAGAWNRWTDANLMRREIVFDPSVPAPKPVPPPLPPAQAGWESIADFMVDYRTGGPDTGWQYSWNAGGHGAGPSAYQPLLWSQSAGAYKTTGDSIVIPPAGVSRPDSYLSLGAGVGHPGQPGYGVAASYTVQPGDGAGTYRLANSSIAKTDSIVSNHEDGLLVQVYVNSTLTGPIQLVSTNGTSLAFDRNLGRLSVGDTVHVLVNAGGNQNYDAFRGFDFTLERSTASEASVPPQGPTTPAPPANSTQFAWAGIANYQSEFRTGSPAQGWRYLWSFSGKMGNAAHYRQLLWSDVANAYNTTGAATAVNAVGTAGVRADAYLTLGASGGHPGLPGFNAIAAYTIQAEDGAGAYRLTNATIAKSDAVKTGSEDGLAVIVYINNTLNGSLITAPTTGSLVDFSRDLGQLSVGDTIYVAINAVGNQNYDSFRNFNFTIEKLMPVAQSFAAIMAVPEPASAVQAGAMIALLGLRRQRRR